jgi:uncharacterized membrane protein
MGRKINLAVFCIFYFVAGCNHFAHPGFYVKLIPPYFAHPEAINYVSGSLEVICAQLMLFAATRKYGMYLTILLLLLFIPAHVYMIQWHGRIFRESYFPEWVAWLRLFPFQFILIWWAYKTWAVFKIEAPNGRGSAT